MGQANECGSVRMMENSTYTWDLVRTLESAYSVSCKTPTTSNGSSTQTINQEEAQSPKNAQLQTNRIVLSWTTYTQPRAKRGRLGTQP